MISKQFRTKKGILSEPIVIAFALIAVFIIFTLFYMIFAIDGFFGSKHEFTLIEETSSLDLDINLNNYLKTPAIYNQKSYSLYTLLEEGIIKDDKSMLGLFETEVVKSLQLSSYLYSNLVTDEARKETKNCRKEFTFSISSDTYSRVLGSRPTFGNSGLSAKECFEDSSKNQAVLEREIVLMNGKQVKFQLMSEYKAYNHDN